MGKANAFLLFFSLFVALIIGEFMARYFHHAWPFDVEMVTYSHLTPKDAPLRWRFTPNEDRNSLGLRNREVFKKADGQYRILFLGDSLIWSGDTNSGDLYTQVIERNLRRELGKQGGEIEVINAGIPGYTTYQELEFLKLYGVPMEPDFLVLGFVFNDVYYKYLHRPVAGNMIAGEPSVNLNKFDKRSFPGFLFKDSYLAHDVVYYF